MDILHFKELGNTESAVTNAVYLVNDNFWYVPSDALPLYQILKQSDNWLWRYCISKIWGYSKCRHECSCSSARRVSNFNTNLPL